MKIELELLEITTLQDVIRKADDFANPCECSPMQKNLNTFRRLEQAGLIRRNTSGTYWLPTPLGKEVLRQSLPITVTDNLEAIRPEESRLNKYIHY